VVRPANEVEVAAVVTRCASEGAAIVPQGGNTGLVGGSVPRRFEVVLSLRRLDALGPVDGSAMQVTAGAGVTIEQWHHHAHAAGLDAGVDWAARATATVGGAVATNAGGSRVVRFGTMRQQVLGVRAVLADGSTIGSLDGLPKETLGPHLPSLLCGSEGTLAIVTAARLRLVPWYRQTASAWVGLPSMQAAVDLLGAVRVLDGLDAVEVLLDKAVELTTAHLGVTVPTWPSATVYVLIDVARHDDPTDALAAFLATHLPSGDAVVATGEQRRRLMDLRDSVSLAISASGVPLKLDVAVPVTRLAALVATVDAVTADSHAQAVVFGHLAEGNLHVNLLGVPDAHRDRVAAIVLERVVELGGTVSAEHGVGVAKSAWLPRVRGDREVALWRSVKHVLDPEGLLNPGVLFPA